MEMNWSELAKKLNWSQPYLSRVFHGYATPSYAMVIKSQSVTRKSIKWWEDASQSEIQQLLLKLKGV